MTNCDLIKKNGGLKTSINFGILVRNQGISIMDYKKVLKTVQVALQKMS
jgi:hypothetical protein